jgi:hypothetical protein
MTETRRCHLCGLPWNRCQGHGRTSAEPTPIPEHLMRNLRERKGLEPDDASQDRIIRTTPAIDNLKDLCIWEFGDPLWANWFIHRAHALGIDLIRDDK